MGPSETTELSFGIIFLLFRIREKGKKVNRKHIQGNCEESYFPFGGAGTGA
jgi:hypothetical protein